MQNTTCQFEFVENDLMFKQDDFDKLSLTSLASVLQTDKMIL